MDTKSYKDFRIDGGPNFNQLETIRRLVEDGKYPVAEFTLNENTSIEAKITEINFYTDSVIMEGEIPWGEYIGKEFRAYYDSIRRTGTLLIPE